MKKLLILIILTLYSGTVFGVSETFDVSTTWVAPVGVTSVDVECWGGGGGGSYISGDGGGGGGGAYSKKLAVSVTPGNSYTVNIGSGGISANPNGPGGGDTWFIDTATVLARGGRGATSGTGGAGGSTAGIGDTKFSGGNGGNGNVSGGGGGSSAGTAANGGNGGNGDGSGMNGGSAGVAPSGGGAGGSGGADSDQPQNGSAPGGGAGGNGADVSFAARGASGRIILTYTVSASAPAGVQPYGVIWTGVRQQ